MLMYLYLKDEKGNEQTRRMKMKLVMYAHGGSKNHGCEAIVRTTAKLLTEIDSRPILLSYKKEEDEAYGLHQFVEIRQELHEINKKSPDFYAGISATKAVS